MAIPLLNDAKTQRIIVDKATLLLDKLFPAGLDAMYNRMLLDLLESQYDKYPRKITVDILHCLTVAMRPIIRMELEAITDFDNDTIEDTLNAFRHILARKKEFHQRGSRADSSVAEGTSCVSFIQHVAG